MPRGDLPLAMASATGVAGLTIGGLFRQQARYRGRECALETQTRTLTYAELNARANRLAHAFTAMGLRAGDCVSVLSENRSEYVEVQLASAKLGMVVACQNWRLAPQELDYCIALVQPRVLFASASQQTRAEGAAKVGCAVVLFGADYERMLADSSEQEPVHAALPEDPWVILFTSGSTGFPKAAAISHRALLARGAIAVADAFVHPGRTFIAWAPMFHIASTDATMISLLHGGAVLLLDGFDPDFIADVLTKRQIGTLSLMPATIAPLIESLTRTGRPALGVLTTGAMADLVPPHQIAEITSLLGAPYRNSFGSTETGYAPASKGVIPVGVVPRSFSKTQSSYCEVRLVDAEGTDVPDGEPGEVLMRGPSLFSGYWNASDINATLFSSGWYAMGDVMRRNADGTLDFIDRRKYLIKSGGENIYPAEIERLLLASPRIADAAVPADPTLAEADVVPILRGQIANYKLPKRVILISASEMPRNPLGKIQRQLLEERLRTELTH